MKQSIAWHIGPDAKPARLKPGAIDLEQRLEDWLTGDIDIVASDILVISRQAHTAWGSRLDLLAIDREGNLVIVELKRDQTLRDTVAQAIEYAAWAATLSYDQVRELASRHFGSEDALEDRFQERFGAELPETLNQAQRILVVAPTIDEVTETVVNYLAEAFKMPINAVGFDVFGEPGNLTLVRQLAIENGVGDIVDEFLALSSVLPNALPYYLTFNLRARGPGKSWLTGLSVYPTAETRPGAVELFVAYSNLRDIFGLDLETVSAFAERIDAAAAEKLSYNWEGWSKLLISTHAQAVAICSLIRELVGAGRSLVAE